MSASARFQSIASHLARLISLLPGLKWRLACLRQRRPPNQLGDAQNSHNPRACCASCHFRCLESGYFRLSLISSAIELGGANWRSPQTSSTASETQTPATRFLSATGKRTPGTYSSKPSTTARTSARKLGRCTEPVAALLAIAALPQFAKRSFFNRGKLCSTGFRPPSAGRQYSAPAQVRTRLAASYCAPSS